MSAALPWVLLALPAAIPAAVTALNLLTWPAGRPAEGPTPRVSVLVPARDEAARIEACVRAALASRPAALEVVVYDDGSTDGTGEILARLAAEEPRLRVLQGGALPAGWVGKPHACHQLARAARGEVLLFIDADTVLEAEGVGRILGLLARRDPLGRPTDLVTAVPLQELHGPAEQLLMPLLHLSYAAWLPLFLVRWTRHPAVLAANGQVLAVRRHAYRRAGGFEAVKNEVVDDMAFCRQVKGTGGMVSFADGRLIARCRMYTSAREIWEGFSKNTFEGLGERPAALLGVLGLYTGTLLLPWLALGLALAGLLGTAWLGPAAVGVGLNLGLRGALAWRFRHPAWSVLAHPLAVLGFLAIAANSWRWSRQGRIRWRGRTYAARSERSPAPSVSRPRDAKPREVPQPLAPGLLEAS